MKAGANKTDLSRINTLAGNGESADYISRALQIDIDVIKSFMPKKKESKSKSKLADNSSD